MKKEKSIDKCLSCLRVKNCEVCKNDKGIKGYSDNFEFDEVKNSTYLKNMSMPILSK